MASGSEVEALIGQTEGGRIPGGPSVVHAYCRRETGLHGIPLDEAVAAFRLTPAREGGDRSVLWIDVVCPGEAEAELLRDRLGLHPLAVEDCLRGRQRPKLDRYPGYFFLVLYAAAVNRERNRTALEELHVFVGEHFLITVHDHKLREVREVLARWRTSEEAFPSVGHLAHGLLDAVVDSYPPVIDFLGHTIEDLEHDVLEPRSYGQMQQILGLRRELAAVRRMLSPTRDILRTLLRRDVLFLRPELAPYFQDVLDHAERGAEELDSLRDTLAATLDAYLSLSANQLNQTMRLMAAWSIILMAMAWIAGVYGMNFAIMPELQWRFGYPWAVALMLALGGGIFTYFRRRGWL
jgi:magnesium transporter